MAVDGVEEERELSLAGSIDIDQLSKVVEKEVMAGQLVVTEAHLGMYVEGFHVMVHRWFLETIHAICKRSH